MSVVVKSEQFLPGGSLKLSRDVFGRRDLHVLGSGYYRIWWVEARDFAQNNTSSQRTTQPWVPAVLMLRNHGQGGHSGGGAACAKY